MIKCGPLPDPKTAIKFLKSKCKLVSGVYKVVKIAHLARLTFRLITFDGEELEKCSVAQITRNELFFQYQEAETPLL